MRYLVAVFLLSLLTMGMWAFVTNDPNAYWWYEATVTDGMVDMDLGDGEFPPDDVMSDVDCVDVRLQTQRGALGQPGQYTSLGTYCRERPTDQ